jgi:hypothetical protein
VSIVVGVALFLVLAGTGVATASWTAGGGSLGVSASAGSLSFTQSGGTNLTGTYKSNTTMFVALVTVTNTGTVPSTFTLGVKSGTQTSLSDALIPSGWFVTGSTTCPATPPTGAMVGTSLTSGISLVGTSLAPQASAYLCIETAMGPTVRKGSADIYVTLTAQVGTWVSQSAVLVAQSSN